MTHHVIYVPGLGDNLARGQQWLPRLWQLFGVKGHYMPMHWSDKEPFAPKLQRLLDTIDSLSADGSPVSLVGTSAGASAVLIAFEARLDKVSGVVCVCGKINHPETIHPERYIANPAFKESMSRLQSVLPKLNKSIRSRILSIRPLHDGSVPPSDTIILGARGRVIPTVGHSFSIGVAVVFGAYAMIRFLKRTQRAVQKNKP